MNLKFLIKFIRFQRNPIKARKMKLLTTTKLIRLLFLVNFSTILMSCMSGTEEDYSLHTPNIYIAEISEEVTDECLKEYDKLKGAERIQICENEECAEHFSICLPEPPKPEENTNLLCSDGNDNDHDGDIDCDDKGCENVLACLPDGENTFDKCTDGIDNDDDELIDCEDIDCSHLEPCLDIPVLPDPTENTNLLCSDGKDNDGDSDIDCDDKSCENVLACLPDGENTFDKCTDGIDNDDDNLIDCEDIDCAHLEPCIDIPVLPDPMENTNLLCTDGKDNDGDGDIDCDDKGCENVAACLPDGENTFDKCTDGIDNDDDNLIDCEDIDCAHIDECLEKLENSFDLCTDGEDNDDDNLIDCEDPDCINVIACLPDKENTYALCSDNQDNDGDGNVDCDDEDCSTTTYCIDVEPDIEDTYAECSDGIDNDNDNLIDCQDMECEKMEHCLIPATVENTNVMCSDGIDNDNDNLIDCDDDSCEEVMACLPNITVTPLSSVAPDSPFQNAADNVISGVNWYVGNAGTDSPIAGPSATISTVWGGMYYATGSTGNTRNEINLSDYFYNKLKFQVRTTCSENDLDLKVQWKSPDPADQVGLAYNFTVKVKELIPDNQNWNVGDNQWHEYEIDFARAVKMSFSNSRDLVIPFSLWCTSNATNASIEAQNLRFEGAADINCIEITGIPDLENTIYCDMEE